MERTSHPFGSSTCTGRAICDGAALRSPRDQAHSGLSFHHFPVFNGGFVNHLPVPHSQGIGSMPAQSVNQCVSVEEDNPDLLLLGDRLAQQDRLMGRRLARSGITGRGHRHRVWTIPPDSCASASRSTRFLAPALGGATVSSRQRSAVLLFPRASARKWFGTGLRIGRKSPGRAGPVPQRNLGRGLALFLPRPPPAASHCRAPKRISSMNAWRHGRPSLVPRPVSISKRERDLSDRIQPTCARQRC